MRRLLALVLFAGCVPTSYTFTPATKGVGTKPDGCKYDVVLSGEPKQTTEDVGDLALYNGSAPKDESGVRKALGNQVCQAGGDAVVMERDDKGGYIKGRIVKYREAYAEPVKPVSDMPATQQTDTEKPK
jgi:hypothetical protein